MNGTGSGKTPGRFIADEIAKPLDLELWIGLPQAQEHRVAPHFSDRPTMTLEQWKGLLAGFGIDVTSRVAQTMMHMLQPLHFCLSSSNVTTSFK